MAEFFDMGGYAVYVWSAYAGFALILLGLVLASLRDAARAKRRLQDLEARHGRVRRRAR